MSSTYPDQFLADTLRLLAEIEGTVSPFIMVILISGVMAILMVIVALMFRSFYKKCPPNRIMVVSKLESEPHFSTSGMMVVPVLHAMGLLVSEPITLELKGRTHVIGLRIDVEAYKKAYLRLLDKNPDAVRQILTDMLMAHAEDEAALDRALAEIGYVRLGNSANDE